MSFMSTRFAGAVAGLSAIAIAGAASAEVDLPNNLAWTAYDTGSSGHAQSVAIGKAFKEKYGGQPAGPAR